jgi:cobalt-zinc-cadmium efflux system outer membrane protein
MFPVISLVMLLAQDTVRAPAKLELSDVYAVAERRSPRIAASKALAAAAAARTSAARRPPDPQVQIGVMNYSVTDWRPMDALGMTQVQAMQMLPIAKLGLAGRVADLAADAESERAVEALWDVRARAAMVFYDLYGADQSLAIDRETLRLLQNALSVAEAMYRVGDGRQADVLRAQVEIARMVQDTVRMTSMRAAMVARLGAVLNDATVDGTPALPELPESVPTLDALTAAALAGRPMLHAGQRDLDAAGTRVALARRDIWPDIALGVQYAERGSPTGAERMGSIMVGATLPVFARSRQLRMRDEASAMRQMSLADLDAMRAETIAAVIEARANLVRARTLSSLYRTSLLPQAEAATESALASYRVGRVDFMTLLDNRMGVNRYWKELALLEADQGKAWAELEMLTGRELFASRSSVSALAGTRKSP